MVMLTTKMFLHRAHVPKLCIDLAHRVKFFRGHHSDTGNYRDRKGLLTKPHLATSSHPVPRVAYQKGSQGSAAHSSPDCGPALTILWLPSSHISFTTPGTCKEPLELTSPASERSVETGAWNLEQGKPGARKCPPPL